MVLDDRLKKRAVSQSNKNDGPLSGNDRAMRSRKTGGYPVGPHHVPSSAANGRTRIRRRVKGPRSGSRISVRCVSRRAMNMASRFGMRKHGYIWTNSKLLGFLVIVGAFSFIIFSRDDNQSRRLRTQIKWTPPEIKIFFPTSNVTTASQTFFHLDAIELGSAAASESEDDSESGDDSESKSERKPKNGSELKNGKDFGGLKLGDFKGQPRKISDVKYLSKFVYHHPHQARDDDGNDAYLAFDDDFLRGTEGTLNVQTGQVCHRTSEHRVNFQNCNSFYELNWLENHLKYLNAGSYRQVFSLQHSFLQQNESIAVKDMYLGNEFTHAEYEFVRMDAMVAERLTSSPRIYEIYGFCGLSILSEFFPHGDMEDVAVSHGEGYLLTEEAQEDYLDELEPFNDLSNEQRLVMSLQMAESLADLHGDISGAIAHQDVQLGQFLFNDDKSLIKLNDFNRAEFLLYDEKGQKYCKYGEGQGAGNWRSPEEYFDHDLTEQVDVFSLGNNMYALLTGLYPFYDSESDTVAKNRVKHGIKAYIDPRYLKERSLAEAKLAEIIDRCWAFKPENRPSIFEVVAFLRDALKQVREESGKHSDQVKDK